MAVRFSKEDNANIKRVVDRFNAKVRYHERLGESNLPSKITIKFFKESFKTRRELEKQLKIYSQFGKRSALKKLDVPGATITNWDKLVIEKNKDKAIEFYKGERARFKQHKSEYEILRRENITSTTKKIRALEKSRLNPKLLKQQRGLVEGYLKYYTRNRQGRQNWINRLEWAGNYKKIDPKLLKSIEDKIMGLSTDKYYELYTENPAFTQVFENFLLHTQGADLSKEDIEVLYQQLDSDLLQIIQ